MKLHRCGRKCVRSMSREKVLKGLNEVLLWYCMKSTLHISFSFFLKYDQLFSVFFSFAY